MLAACGVIGFQTACDRWIASEVLLHGHRQKFWIAARRWTMRAIEAGLSIQMFIPEGFGSSVLVCRKYRDCSVVGIKTNWLRR
jgi:hypothetical protein